MKPLELDLSLPHKVADISLAEWGRREMELAELEMLQEIAVHKIMPLYAVFLFRRQKRDLFQKT